MEKITIEKWKWNEILRFDKKEALESLKEKSEDFDTKKDVGEIEPKFDISVIS